MDTASGRLRTLGAPRKIYVHYMSVGWPCIQTSESEVNNSAIVTTMVSMVQVWAIAERSKRGVSPIFCPCLVVFGGGGVGTHCFDELLFATFNSTTKAEPS